MIVSFTEGRVRYRHQGLRREPLLLRLSSALKAQAGVERVSFNSSVGSVLVWYDKALTGVEAISSIFQKYLPNVESVDSKPTTRARKSRQFQFKIRPSVSKRQITNYGMAGSLLGCLAALPLGALSLHVQLGILFVALSAYHMADKRRTLLV